MPNLWIIDRLRALGRSQADLARALNLQPPAVNKIISGLRKIQSDEVRLLAIFLEWSEADVLAWIEKSRGRSDAPTPARPTSGRVLKMIEVSGVVHAGYFKPSIELPPEERYTIQEYIQPPFDRMNVQAFEVKGSSMDKVYPDRSLVLVVDAMYLGEGWRPRDGQRVLVQRRNQWGEVECTIKEVAWDDDEMLLWPRSHDPAYREPWKAQLPEGDGSFDEHSDNIRVTGLVIRGIIPEPTV